MCLNLFETELQKNTLPLFRTQFSAKMRVDINVLKHSNRNQSKIPELERELKVHRDPEVTSGGSRPQIAETRQAPRAKRVKLAHAQNNLSTEKHHQTPGQIQSGVALCSQGR